jgi:hypothetical protein
MRACDLLDRQSGKAALSGRPRPTVHVAVADDPVGGTDWVEYPAAVRREPVIVPEPRWLALGSTETVLRWASFTGDGTDGEPQSTELGHRNRYASTLEEFDASDCRFFELDVRGDDPAVTVADDQSSAVRLLSARGRAARARQREREQQREEEAK